MQSSNAIHPLSQGELDFVVGDVGGNIAFNRWCYSVCFRISVFFRANIFFSGFSG